MEVKPAGELSGVVLMPENRFTINKTLREQSKPPDVEGEQEISITGQLRGVQLDKDWLEIVVEGKTVHIIGLMDTVDDVVGPMVNRQVIVRAGKVSKDKLQFIDIELDE